jgi:hypothetical protein
MLAYWSKTMNRTELQRFANNDNDEIDKSVLNHKVATIIPHSRRASIKCADKLALLQSHDIRNKEGGFKAPFTRSLMPVHARWQIRASRPTYLLEVPYLLQHANYHRFSVRLAFPLYFDAPRSSEPRPCEELVQINTRHGLVQGASGVYVENNKHITLISRYAKYVPAGNCRVEVKNNIDDAAPNEGFILSSPWADQFEIMEDHMPGVFAAPVRGFISKNGRWLSMTHD